MTPQLKARWIKALRSGRYKQTKCFAGEMLNNKEYNCCLGVLARISHCKWPRIGNTDQIPLPEKILANHIQMKLSGFNDAGWSFKEIANFIETTI
jgi:hypothetical protein